MGVSNQIIYELRVDTELNGIEDSRKRLVAYKTSIIETENELKKLKAETKGNADAQIAAAGKVAELETKLKTLRNGYQETQRAATGIKGFTEKIGTEFGKSIKPLEGFLSKLDQLGPIGQSLSGLVGKVQGVGNAVSSLAQSNDKLSKGIGAVNGSVKGLQGGLQGIQGGIGNLNTGMGELNSKAAATNQGIGALGKFTNGLGAAFGGAVLGVGALLGALGGLGVGIASSIQAYDESIKANTALSVALGGTSKELEDQASTLQDLTTFQDDAITKGQAFAATMGLTAEQIEQVTPAVLDLAAATGISAEEAFTKVSTSLVGSKNALARYGVELSKTAPLAERVTQVVDGLGKSFGGQAEALASVGSSSIVRFQNTVNDLEETLGGIIIRGLSPFVDGLRNAVHALDDAIQPAQDVKEIIAESTKELRSQQSEYASLIVRLEDANTKEDERKDIIEQLNTKYKAYLPQLVSEKSTNEELTLALRKGNDEFIRRIALRGQESVLQAAAENSGELLRETTNKEIELRKAIADRAAEMDRAAQSAGKSQNLLVQLAGKSLEDQIALIRKARREVDEGGSLFGSAGGVDPVEGFNLQLVQLRKKQAEATGELKKAQEQLTVLQEQFGVTTYAEDTAGDAALEFAKKLEQAKTAAENGTATTEQLRLVLGSIDKEFRSGTASAKDMGDQVKQLNTIIENLPATPGNASVRDALISERDAIQKQIKQLSGEKVKADLSDAQKTEQAYQDRLKTIRGALDLEIGVIDQAEAQKRVKEDEANVMRLTALKRFLDDRAALERDNAVKDDGKVSEVEVVRIAGIEGEAAMVEKELNDLKAKLAAQEAAKVKVIHAEFLDAQFSSALAAFDSWAAKQKEKEAGMELSAAELNKREKKRTDDRKKILLDWNAAKVGSAIQDAEIEERLLLTERATTGGLSADRDARLKDLQDFIAQQKEILQGISTDQEGLGAGSAEGPSTSPLAKALGLDEDSVNFYLSAAQSLSDSLSEILIGGAMARNQRVLEDNLSSLDDQHDQYISSLQDQLAQGQITQEQADQLKLLSEKAKAAEEEKLKKDAVAKDKKLKRTQATLEFVLELARLAATAPQAGIAAPVWYGVNAAIAAVRYAANLAAIGNANYRDGGEVPNRNGVAIGPSHENGGIPFRVKGSPVVHEMEGSEFIVRKSSVTPETLPVLRSINERGHFAKGGFVPHRYANGGGVELQPSPAIVASRYEADERRRAIPTRISNEGVQPIVKVSDIEKIQSQTDSARSKVRVGN